MTDNRRIEEVENMIFHYMHAYAATKGMVISDEKYDEVRWLISKAKESIVDYKQKWDDMKVWAQNSITYLNEQEVALRMESGDAHRYMHVLGELESVKDCLDYIETTERDISFFEQWYDLHHWLKHKKLPWLSEREYKLKKNKDAGGHYHRIFGKVSGIKACLLYMKGESDDANTPSL